MDELSGSNEDGIQLCPFSVYLSEGVRLMETRKWQKAIEKFDVVLEIQPENVQSLVLRSKCNLAMGDNKEALLDAERAIEVNPEYIQGTLMKAEILYNMGKFEHALIYFQRGYHARPEVEEFRLGIQEAKAAIENAIGHRDTFKYGDTKSMLEQIAEKEREALMVKKVRVHPAMKQTTRKVPEDQNPRVSRQILGPLYHDKAFFTILLKCQDLKIGNSNTRIEQVKETAQDALEYLNQRQEFWLQQKPLYCRERERKERLIIKGSSRRKANLGVGSKESSTKVVKNIEEYKANLRNIDEHITKKDFESALGQANDTLNSIMNLSDKAVQNKGQMLAQAYLLHGKASLHQRDFETALRNFLSAFNIAQDQRLSHEQYCAGYYIGVTHGVRGSYIDAIAVFEPLILVARKPETKTVLYHHIALCNLMLKRFQVSKFFSQKSIEESYCCNESHIEFIRVCSAMIAFRSEVLTENIKNVLELLKDVLNSLQSKENEKMILSMIAIIEKAPTADIQGPDLPNSCLFGGELFEMAAPSVLGLY